LKYRKFVFQEHIIYEDNDYFVLNKPPFISTLADRSGESNLLELSRMYHTGAQVCHRLDKETSGVLVFSRHNEAYKHLNLQFEHREVEKTYHALADGVHNFVNKEVKAAIHKLSDGSVRIQKEGKQALTLFTSIKAYRMHTLIECKPVTGRMHQIRIHLAHIGAPISGDTMYGGKPFYLSAIKKGFKLKKWAEEEPLLKRFALHAFKLRFKLMDGAEITVEAPYAADFGALINQLEKA